MIVVALVIMSVPFLIVCPDSALRPWPVAKPAQAMQVIPLAKPAPAVAR
jgi:hypothetical protein